MTGVATTENNMASNGVSPHSSTSKNSNQKTMASPTSPATPTLPNHVVGVDGKSTVTPEQDHHHYLTRATALANAPQRKNFRQSPLIRTKLKKDDVGDDAEKVVVVKGSKASTVKQVNPLTHTKITERKADQDSSSKNPIKLTNGSVEGTRTAGTTTTTIKVSKGIEMKRTKKQVATSASAITGGKTQGVTKPDSGKVKPTRTTVAAHYVPTKPGPSQSLAVAVAQKKKAADKPANKPSTSVADNKIPKLMNGVSEAIPTSDNKGLPAETRSVEPAIPATKASTTEPQNDKPVKYFKSKFSVDTSRKPESSVPKPKKDLKDENRRKDLKSYIEKQREIRLIKQKKDEEEKRMAQEKKKKELEELREKCREIVTSSAKSQTAKTPPSCAFVLSDKQPMKQFRNKQSLSPLKARRTVPTKNQSPAFNGMTTLTEDSVEAPREAGIESVDIDLRTSVLLREFEHIVQKECMQILRTQQPSKSPSKGRQPATASKVDAAVETTGSLFKQYNEALPEVRNSLERRTTMFQSFLHDSKHREDQQAMSMDVKNKAATNIQAAYKGYRTRRILKEANVFPKTRKQNRIMTRDWPFATPPVGRTQEKASLEEARKSNAARGSSNWDFPYIPPPEQNYFGSSNLKGLPVTCLSHIELSRFQEPFPKEAIRRLSAIHSSPRPKSFYERRYSDSSFNVPASASKSGLDVDSTDSPRPLEDISAPRFSTVLKEKVRLLEEKTAIMIRGEEKKASPTRMKRLLRERPHQRQDGIQEETASEIPSERLTTTNTITEEYIGPVEKKMKQAYTPRTSPRPIEPKSPRRSKNTRKKKLSLSTASPTKSGSTTTVETDVDLQSERHADGSTSRQDEVRQSSSKDGVLPSSSLGIDKYPTPALQLQFQAEKERLHILGEALKTTLAAEARNVEEGRKRYEAQKPEEELESSVTKLNNNSSLNGSHDYMIQLAKCQADCLKATAEVTKWMTELRKAEKEREIVQRDQQTVNMAAVVFAAVEKAKRLSDINSSTVITERREEVLRQREKADEITQFPSERSELFQDGDLEITPAKFDSSSSMSTGEAMEKVERVAEPTLQEPEPPVVVPDEDTEHSFSFLIEEKTATPDSSSVEPKQPHAHDKFEENEDDREEHAVVSSQAQPIVKYQDAEYSLKPPSPYSGPASKSVRVLEEVNLADVEFVAVEHAKGLSGIISSTVITEASEDVIQQPDMVDNFKQISSERLKVFEHANLETERATTKLGSSSSTSEAVGKADRVTELAMQEPESPVAVLDEDTKDSFLMEEVKTASRETSFEEPEQAEEHDKFMENEEDHDEHDAVSSHAQPEKYQDEEDSLKPPPPYSGPVRVIEEVSTAAVVFAAVEKAKRLSDINSSTVITEKREEVLQEREFTQFSSERSEVFQDKDLDDFEVPLTPTRLDDSSSASETVEKVERITEPIVQEPESPVAIPDEDAEDSSFLIEEVKTASPDTSSEGPERAFEHDKFVENEEGREENDALSRQAQPETKYHDEDNPVKPPPPYSGPVSKPVRVIQEINNTCKDWQLRDMIQQHIDYIWDSWITSKRYPPGYEQFSSKLPSDPEGRCRKGSENVYEQLISDTICEIIQEILDVAVYPSLEKSYEDQVRLGPLAMKAQRLKLPQTKERLLQQVYEEVLCLIPPVVVIFTNGANPQPEKRCPKWSCRQRDLPDEVLAQELVKEDRTWLNCWPEEVIVQNRLAEGLLKRLISQVVQSFEVALK